MGLRAQITANGQTVALGDSSAHFASTKVVEISGNFIGTLQFEACRLNDPAAARFTVLATAINSQTPATSLVFVGAGDKNGLYWVDATGLKLFVTSTAFSSGVATIETDDVVG